MEEKKYPSQLLLERYLPVKDVPKYYSITEETVNSLIKERKVHYAELKSSETGRRVLQVDMSDVLKALGRRVRLFHLEGRGEEDAE